VRGWVEGSGQDIAEVAARFDDAGFAALIVTQINVDGAGTGPDIALYEELLGDYETELIASGGVGSTDDLRHLARLGADTKPLLGAIVGKALYDGALTIDDALAAAGAE
jgi:phosphoribosylformimino-5-aminoimidazole carboxamide ribotide isomerase